MTYPETPSTPTDLPGSPQGAYGPSEIQHFKGSPIRTLLVNNIPWFALPDLCDALGYSGFAAHRLNSPSFPAHAKMVCDEEPDPDVPGEPQEVTIVSPVGVWWWTHLTDPARGQSLAAWAKREALRVNPTADPSDPFVFLTLQHDGSLPPYPLKFSGRKSEWIALKEVHMLTGARRYELRGRPLN